MGEAGKPGWWVTLGCLPRVEFARQRGKAQTLTVFFSSVSVSVTSPTPLPGCSLLLCTSDFSVFFCYPISPSACLFSLCLIVSHHDLSPLCLLSDLSLSLSPCLPVTHGLSPLPNPASTCVSLPCLSLSVFISISFSPSVSLCLSLPSCLCPSSSLQMRMPAALEGDSSMQMTGWLGLWLPQPGLLGLHTLLEGMVLGAKEEVAVPATTRAGAGVGGHLLVFTPKPSSFSPSQPWPCLDLDNRGGVP